MPITARLLPALALLLTLIASSGCELFGPILEAGRENPPVYTLPKDKVTAILVDDPQNLLTDPLLRGIIASRIKFELEQNKVATTIVDPSAVTRLESEMTGTYYTTPTDVIGRKLGADQVISIYIEQHVLRSTPATYKPSIRARVKVIDVNDAKRLFPPLLADNPEDPTAARRGWLVETAMRESAPLEEGRGEEAILLKRLSDRFGRDVARLFFAWSGRQPGQPFED